jgi:hypothetical protein
LKAREQAKHLSSTPVKGVDLLESLILAQGERWRRA